MLNGREIGELLAGNIFEHWFQGRPMINHRYSCVAAALLLALHVSPAVAQIKIAVAGPITGPNAAFGEQLFYGAKQAVDDLNARKGVLGEKIELVVFDDESDPEKGVAAANRLADEGVKFVVGHFNSGVTIPATEVYARRGIVAISAGSTAEMVTERGLWNVFRVCGRDDQQSEVASQHLLTAFKGKKVAFAHDKTVYGQGLAAKTKAHYNDAGQKEVLWEAIDFDDEEFAGLAKRVKASGADVFYWGGQYTEGAAILKQLRKQGSKVVFFSGDGIVSEQFAELAGAAAEGSIATFGPDQRNRAEAKAVVAKFRANLFEPESFTLYSYAAVQVLVSAMKQVGGPDPRAAAELMRTSPGFKTVIGLLTFDKKGDVKRPDFVIWTWKKDPNMPGKIIYAHM
jgi:branched-chain amino acid transport system substrate-binding protein